MMMMNIYALWPRSNRTTIVHCIHLVSFCQAYYAKIPKFREGNLLDKGMRIPDVLHYFEKKKNESKENICELQTLMSTTSSTFIFTSAKK